MTISELVARQRAYFDTGATRPLSFRLGALEQLRQALQKNEHGRNKVRIRRHIAFG